MSPDPPISPTSTAIEQLERFGLSTYAARTYVGLTHLGIGSAREVSEAVEVPRTRVYDAVGELRDRELVDVRESSPKRFWAVSPDTAIRTLEDEFQDRAGRLQSALSELESTGGRKEQRGVWTVEGRSAVSERLLELFADADSEIVYVTAEDLVTDDLIDGLRAAVERGVAVRLAGVSDDRLARVIEASVTDVDETDLAVTGLDAIDLDGLDGVSRFESPWLRSGSPAGRFARTDGRTTLASALVDDGGNPDDDGNPTDGRSEIGVWGNGGSNGVMSVVNTIFTQSLDRADAD